MVTSWSIFVFVGTIVPTGMWALVESNIGIGKHPYPTRHSRLSEASVTQCISQRLPSHYAAALHQTCRPSRPLSLFRLLFLHFQTVHSGYRAYSRRLPKNIHIQCTKASSYLQRVETQPRSFGAAGDGRPWKQGQMVFVLEWAVGPKYRGCRSGGWLATLGAKYWVSWEAAGLGAGNYTDRDSQNGPSNRWQGGKMGCSLTRNRRGFTFSHDATKIHIL